MSFEDDKRSIFERKRNLLYLIHRYLSDMGYHDTKTMLVEETHLNLNEFTICDNIDMDTIYLEFCSYQQLKFGKLPKILKKNIIADDRKSANLKQRQKNQRHTSVVTTTNCDESSSEKMAIKVPVLESSITIKSIKNNQVNTIEIDQNCGGCGAGGVNSKISSNNNKLNHFSVCDTTVIPNFEHFTQEWKDIANIICRDIIKKQLEVKWTDVFGAENAKTILKEGIIMPLQYPDLFNSIATKPWKSCLIHGPPGTGKTLIAKALCTETYGKVTFFNVTSSTIISKWRGESEKFVRVLFEVAKIYSPTVIFFDEIEGLASKRDSMSEHEASKRLKNELLTLMDGLESDNSGIFILANTNLPWEIDSAFLRRFERKILIELPKFEERIELIKKFLPFSNRWNQKCLDEASELCNEYTGDEIRIVCKEAIMMEIRKIIQQNNGKLTHKPTINEITFDRLLTAIKQINPSSKIIIAKHLEWNKKFGNKIF